MTEDKIEGFFTGERTMTDFCEGVNIYSDLVRKLIWDEICSTFDYMDSFLNEIKSPIEQALYLAVKNGGCLDSLDRYSKHGFGRESVVFDYQYKIKLESKNYILDFLLAIWLQDDTTLNFAIECDGHDFHEKTKKQAANDRQRERYLMANGYTVIRFTGSEIFNDPYKCADEITSIVKNRIKVHFNSQVGD